MQNVAQGSTTDNPKIEKVIVHHDTGNLPSTPHSTNSSPAKSETETYSEHRQFMSDSSESEEDSVSEVESFVIDQEFEEDPQVEAAKFLLSTQEDRTVDPETQQRLEALLQAAGIGQLATKDGKHLADPEVLRRLTSSVSSALDEAAAALTRMRSDNPHTQPEKTSLVEACTGGDVGTVRKLLTEGRSVHETSEDGESLLSLACSAGYFELAQVLLAMHANVEDRGIKGECTPLMEAASAGHLDIVRLLIAHGADVNAQSTSGNTPLMYGCAGGHQDVVKYLLEKGANVEDHNENGHTPLMEAASAGHVGLAKILLTYGAGINTHSNEFKESALTLACYKGHLDMVKFLLEAGADQEHKTDEMHTALMEASMDGHVEVARLLLDSGAQVNMPTDSFESPLTLAACGGHVDLAMLLIERGANIEEVNDEGYTPLMEAAREGHEDMVALLLSQGANINAQTDETQETALTLACCGGFTEVADFLIKAGADIELGASTPLMEAAQEGHLELVKYLLENNANVHAQTQTGDTALTYACENGHTDVADLLLQYGANMEHESEGGRTPLMKACRAGHLCTVQFLISKGANVRRQTTNNDHTPLSLACAGGHLPVVELLLAHRADPNHKLKDNSTMLIEAAKGGHTNVVQLLLDYPHSMMLNQQASTTATNLSMLPGQIGSPDSPLAQPINFFQSPPEFDFSKTVLQEVPEAVRILTQDKQHQSQNTTDLIKDEQNSLSPSRLAETQTPKESSRLGMLPKSRSASTAFDGSLTSAEAQQVRTQPLTLSDLDDCEVYAATATMEFLAKQDPKYIETNKSILEYVKNRKKQGTASSSSNASSSDEGSTQKKQQILEELHRVDREFHGKQQQAALNHMMMSPGCITQDEIPVSAINATLPPSTLNIDIAMQQQQLATGGVAGLGLSGSMFPAANLQVQNAFFTGGGGATCLQQQPLQAPIPSSAMSVPIKLAGADNPSAFAANNQSSPAFYFAPLNTIAVSLSSTTTPAASSVVTQPIKFQTVTSHAEVSQNTAISDRPKAKPVSKKEGKNLRKQQYQLALYNNQQQQTFTPQVLPTQQSLTAATQIPMQQLQIQQPDVINKDNSLHGLDLDILKDDPQENLLTASILQQFHNSSPTIRAAFVASPVNNDPKNQQRKAGLELYDRAIKEATCKFMERRVKDMRDKDFTPDLVEDVVQTLESYSISEDQQLINPAELSNLQVHPYPATLDESMIASLAAQDMASQSEVSRVEYFAVPSNNTQLPVQVQHTFDPYEHYLQAVGTVAAMPNKAERTGAIYQAGFQAGISLMQHTLATSGESITTTVVPTNVAAISGTSTQPYIQPSSPCTHIAATSSSLVQTTHHCQVPCSQHHQSLPVPGQQQGLPPPTPPAIMAPTSHQVQVATQTPQSVPVVPGIEGKKSLKSAGAIDGIKKKGRFMYRHQNQPAQGQPPQASAFQQNQNYQIDPNSAITQYGASTNQQCSTAATAAVAQGNYCMDVDSETESNHDTALTLACAGGHEELVELLLTRGADIEHRDKKGFTPLILAATAGHEKVVEILLKNSADIEAQSERTKDTPLSLACSGGRYEVVEILLNRNANKEHRNVSDYTPLSLAASGGYVNIIKLLLNHGAEINSRTGSKLGISPLMLAAMNGHTAAVKLLLDMGSDINAQIETNRNTALTLACFQGRHEVVSLLLDRKANVEHRAKTGLTPLMEAASGGYVEVGRVLLDKGADVNATPVPSSRDTALTIAADKGHVRFVELLLCRGAAVEVKNKKGNSPLWLAANGGHLNVVELLYNLSADIDSQDNRKVSCLMAAFRKGHTKVVKWMVNHVTQFPSDQEMIRYISTVSDKDLLEKCQECVKIIRAAKETQAAKANKNASILLEELDMEKNREESKKAAAARRRERKKKKKLEKKEEKRKLTEENKKNEDYDDKMDKCDEEDDKADEVCEPPVSNNVSPLRNGGDTAGDKEEGDSGIDANSQGSCSSTDVKTTEKRKDKKKKKVNTTGGNSKDSRSGGMSTSRTITEIKEVKRGKHESKSKASSSSGSGQQSSVRKGLIFETTRSPAERDDFEATGNETFVPTKSKKSTPIDTDSIASPNNKHSSTSPKQSGKREEGWKEVVRKSSVQTVSTNESGVKKVSVPLNAISRVIGRGGSNINAIRAATGAHIEVEKQSKGQGERIITIKGMPEATKHAHSLIAVLIRDPDVDILQMLPKPAKVPPVSTTSLWDKTQIGTKKVTGKALTGQGAVVTTITSTQQKVVTTVASTSAPLRFTTTTSIKPRTATTTTTTMTRVTAPRLVAQAEKNAAAAVQQQSTNIRNMTTIVTSTRGTTKVITTMATQTFAAKLTDMSSQLQVSVSQASSSANSGAPKQQPPPQQPQAAPPRAAALSVPQASTMGPVSPQSQPPTQASPKHHRPAPTSSAPPNMQHFPMAGGGKLPFGASGVLASSGSSDHSSVISQPCSPTPLMQTQLLDDVAMMGGNMQTQEYSLFNTLIQQPMWRREHHESQKPVNFAAVTGGGGNGGQSSAPPKFVDEELPQVDASKAPGYRGTAVCSPVSSKTSSNSTTPPNLPLGANAGFHGFAESKQLPPIGSNMMHARPAPSSQAPSSQQNEHYYTSSNMQQHVMSAQHSDSGYKSGYADAAPMLNMSSDGHLLQAYQTTSMQFSQQQHQQQQQQQQTAVSMSRLNPKAPDFSSSMHGAQMNKNQMYNGSYQQQHNANNSMYPAPISKPNFHRSAASSSSAQNRWPYNNQQIPFNAAQQSELMSGMAGMTIQNLARATDILENGGELGGGNSPAMSPNLPPHNLLMNESMYIGEDRKQPQPIGTERARKSFNQLEMLGGHSISGFSDKSGGGNGGRQWTNNTSAGNNTYDRFNGTRNQNAMYGSEDVPQHLMDNFQPPQFDNMMQQYLFAQQHIHMNNLPPPHEFPPEIKLDMPTWDSRHSNIPDIQDKQQHGWSGLTNKWNQ